MRQLVLVLFVLVGCNKRAGDLDELAKIRDAMCACKDSDCSDAVYDGKYYPWKNNTIDKPTAEWTKRFTAIDHELLVCRHDSKRGSDDLGSAAKP